MKTNYGIVLSSRIHPPAGAVYHENTDFFIETPVYKLPIHLKIDKEAYDTHVNSADNFNSLMQKLDDEINNMLSLYKKDLTIDAYAVVNFIMLEGLEPYKKTTQGIQYNIQYDLILNINTPKT